MIKMLTAYTDELDEIDIAVAEITDGLDLENNQLKNSLGVITCYSEYIDTGVVKAVCDTLPFDVIGCTTINNAVSGSNGMMQLSLSVLTSDDVEFTTVVTGAIDAEMAPIQDAYKKTAASLNQKPGMILTFLPLIISLGGEIMLQTIDEVCEGVPIFGTIACDHLPDYSATRTIYNGEAYGENVVMALLTGNVNPKFFVYSIPEKKIQKQRAIITDAKSNLVKKVNDIHILDYMRDIGMAEGDGIEGMSTIPFIVDYNDGTPRIARALYAVVPDGIVCGGGMPVGGTIAIGSINAPDVLESAGDAVNQSVEKSENNGGVLIFPCLSRLAALGFETSKELNVIEKVMGSRMPYSVCYSGGEICPVVDQDGNYKNRFHNFSMIGWIL